MDVTSNGNGSHEKQPAHPTREFSKRGHVGEGRHPPGLTKLTPELVQRFANYVAAGVTDKEAELLCGIKDDSPTALKKVYPEIIESAVAARLLKRIERIEKGESGWQATAWPLDRQFAEGLARAETQIAIIHQNNQQKNTVTAAAQPLSGQIVAPEREKGWGQHQITIYDAYLAQCEQRGETPTHAGVGRFRLKEEQR
jgi:hypothetical protein